jgi:hypothetical protein
MMQRFGVSGILAFLFDDAAHGLHETFDGLFHYLDLRPGKPKSFSFKRRKYGSHFV